jgi:hypothetical protein
MANNNDATAISHSSVDRFSQIMERVGLAIMGALCGLFVAAFVARANIGEINSLGALFSAILYGSSESDRVGERHRHLCRRRRRADIGLYDHL